MAPAVHTGDLVSFTLASDFAATRGGRGNASLSGWHGELRFSGEPHLGGAGLAGAAVAGLC